jgi:hypothetical protein
MRQAGLGGCGAAGRTDLSLGPFTVQPRRPSVPLPCLRCGFPIRLVRPSGCKNPCPNCGTIYPLGDCSD